MNKAGLIAHVATQTAVPKATADSIVDAVFTAIGDALAHREKVSIAGFGTFTTRDRPARQGRNPRTGERTAATPSFKPGNTLRDAVNRTPLVKRPPPSSRHTGASHAPPCRSTQCRPEHGTAMHAPRLNRHRVHHRRREPPECTCTRHRTQLKGPLNVAPRPIPYALLM